MAHIVGSASRQTETWGLYCPHKVFVSQLHPLSWWRKAWRPSYTPRVLHQCLPRPCTRAPSCSTTSCTSFQDELIQPEAVSQGALIPPRGPQSPERIDFSGCSVVKNLPANAGDVALIPGLGRLLGEGNSPPLQYSHLENPVDRRAWWAIVHGVTRVRHDLVTEQPPLTLLV